MMSIYKTNPIYSAQTISGTTVIIPVSEKCPKFNGMMKLEGIGAFLWNEFEKGISLEDVCHLVVKKYEVSYETAYADAEAFVNQLVKNGLLLEIAR